MFRVDRDEYRKMQQDIQRRFKKDPRLSLAGKLLYFWDNIQYRTLLLFRLWRICSDIPLLGYILKRLYRRASLKSGIEIFCSVGGGVIMPHFGPVKINAHSVGDNLYIFHNVTIGHDYRTGKPTIGNNVFIGTNSLVLGDITIGDNVVIGATSFVTSDIPPNSLVTGNPAKVLKSIDADYIEKMIGY